jgi:hypothetical protein
MLSVTFFLVGLKSLLHELFKYVVCVCVLYVRELQTFEQQVLLRNASSLVYTSAQIVDLMNSTKSNKWKKIGAHW